MTWQFSPIQELESRIGEWQELNRQSANSPLLDQDFVLPLARAFATGHEILGTYRVGQSTAAMGLFQQTSRLSWQTFQPANAPLGLWISAPKVNFIDCLSKLVGSLPGITLVAGLSQLDPEHFPRPRHTSRLRTTDYISTAHVTVQGTFDEYWNQRSKNFRRDIKRQSNRLEREGTKPRFEILRAPHEMLAAVEAYAELEQSGWKASIDTAVSADAPQGQFYVDMLEHFAAKDKAVIYQYYLGDSLVASDICIEGDHVVIVLKTAHDHSVKGISPAQLMRYEIFRHIFEKGDVRRIEFYGPVMDWHLRWTEDVRKIYHVNCFRWIGIAALQGFRARRIAGQAGSTPNRAVDLSQTQTGKA
jgi:CelD/BcsL family acetyltransferase involved in cellulose biosynthesis